MYRVLIVDDEKSILEGLECIINWEEFGIEIAGLCSNGIDALNVIDNTKIHILITDIKMFKMNGLELINQIRERSLNIKCIVLSGYDDFDYVKEAMLLGIENYLLKPVPVDELTATLKNAIGKIESETHKNIELRKGIDALKDNILNRWVKSDIEKDEFFERAVLLNLNIGTSDYVAAVLKVYSSKKEAAESRDPKKRLLRIAINNLCDEVLTKNHAAVTFCDLNGDVVILYSNRDYMINPSIVKDTLLACMKNINESLGVEVFVTVGNMVKHFDDTGISYENARSLQEYQLIMPPNSLLCYNEILKSTENYNNRIRISFEVLQKCIYAKDRKGAISFIESVYKQLKSIDGLDPEYIRNLSIEILLYIKQNFNKHISDSDLFFHEFINTFSNILQINSMWGLEEWMKEIIAKAFDIIEYKSNKFSPLIKRVISYTENSYIKNINLKTIAADFRVNPGYLGYLFKRETGDLFNNYLNNVRLEAAKKLLTGTKTKIGDIAIKVGYANISYFNIIFRKNVNMSPADYRFNFILATDPEAAPTEKAHIG